MNPSLAGLTAVTFNTAVAAAVGTPPRPITWTSVTEPADRTPPPERESYSRNGWTVTSVVDSGPGGVTAASVA